MKQYILFIFCFLFVNSISFAKELIYTSSDDTDITLNTYASEGNHLIIWLAPEYGFREAHHLFADNLAKHTIEVWQCDMAESLFLPQGSTSIKSLDGTYIAELIEHAYLTTGKKVIVAGDSYGALAALKGAHAWQRKQGTKASFIGAVLFSPYTYAYIPPLGMKPEYMPVVEATNIPMIIYQAKDSGTIGQFPTLLNYLRKHNSPVYTKYVSEVMSLFYKSPPSNDMLTHAKPLPSNIYKMLKLLESHSVPDKAISFKAVAEHKSGIDLYLKPFNGKASPLAIKLKEIEGDIYLKESFKNKVTVVNFWATWCPPCIEEIPSLNRLNAIMKSENFELISINYAEKESEIRQFKQQIPIEFPVLLDYDGEFSKQWNIVTYPSTFIIDKKGNIRYGVNAAIEWDNPELIKKLAELTEE